MNKGLKYFTDGILSAFVLAPRVPVQPVEPAEMKSYKVSVGNSSKYWEKVGQKMSIEANQISQDYHIPTQQLKSS